MSRDTQTLLEAFEHLPAEEKRAFTEEVLRRIAGSGPDGIDPDRRSHPNTLEGAGEWV